MQAVLKLLAKVAAKTIIMVLTTLFKTSDFNLLCPNLILIVYIIYFWYISMLSWLILTIRRIKYNQNELLI